MKIILFSDLHIHKFNPFATVIDGVHSRVAHSLEVLKQIFNYAQANGIENIFFGGDLFDTKSILNTEFVDLAYTEFNKVKDQFNFYFRESL